ncbi:hypothetical protein [Stenotrophomonas sp. 24(2023)]|uniref:hypothetical protein n=1 Tax=Stenotrophomonas sp. 24(2023) TaxID=3068324 RepID=UPI0027E0AE52|nr:hypothetical protein [Stenotrophomonas sp. 24(2023)]WMJ70298.1 hypothetical protein Q9R17_04110 [Stenotrophomonas sp. 24(2023)]
MDLPDRIAASRLIPWLPLLCWVLIGVAWPTPWGVLAGLLAAILAQALLQRHGLIAAAAMRAHQPVPGGQALRSHPAPRFQLRGEAGDQVVQQCEIGMGGPVLAVYVLRDGALIEDVDGGWHDLPDGSRRLAHVYRGQGSHAVALYDERLHQLSLWDDPDSGALWRCVRRQLDEGRAIAAVLPSPPVACLRFVAFRGLWLPPTHRWGQQPLLPLLRHRLADGRELSAPLLLPDDLRPLREPERYALCPPRRLCLQGQDSGHYVSDLEAVVESPTAACVVVGGLQMDAAFRSCQGLWLAHHRQAWWALADTCSNGQTGADHRYYGVKVVSVSDDGLLQLRVMEPAFALEWEQRRPVTGRVYLAVEWQPVGLALDVVDGRAVLRVAPAR